MNKQIVVLFTYLGLASLFFSGGCAIEVENPGKPDKGESSEKANHIPSPDVATSRDGAGSSPQAGPDTFGPCRYTVERKAAGSSGLDGAIVRISQVGAASQAEMFVYVDNQLGYVNVNDVAFSSSGLDPGNYTFVVSRPEVESCSVSIEVKSSDISNKLEIAVQLDD
jgi:hypothetical protein